MTIGSYITVILRELLTADSSSLMYRCCPMLIGYPFLFLHLYNVLYKFFTSLETANSAQEIFVVQHLI